MSLKVGIIGTGAVAEMHARAYRSIGFTVRACADINPLAGRTFAAATGAEFLSDYEEVCRHPEVDFVDICTLPDVRLRPLEIAAAHGKHVQVEKPIAATLGAARAMVTAAGLAGVILGVVSQHRFDVANQFLIGAIRAGRLGRLLQCDAYVKWHRTDDYYARPAKGTWTTEGGGALISQAIHQVDLLRWFAGRVRDVSAVWQLGSIHTIESEDIVNAVLRYEGGATGVIQAATAFWPGYPERIELHGTRGTAIVTGDRITTWDVQDDVGDRPPAAQALASGASDPMALSVAPFERQFLDFGDAIRQGRQPLVSGEEGLGALELVDAIYRSCRTGSTVRLS